MILPSLISTGTAFNPLLTHLLGLRGLKATSMNRRGCQGRGLAHATPPSLFQDVPGALSGEGGVPGPVQLAGSSWDQDLAAGTEVLSKAPPWHLRQGKCQLPSAVLGTNPRACPSWPQSSHWDQPQHVLAFESLVSREKGRF